jgi:hypothetical protein
MRSGEPATVFVKLQEYRRWVGIWSESEGRLWIEEDGGVLHYFSQLEIGAALIFIRRSESEPSRSGKWSKVSNRLSVELAGRQFEPPRVYRRVKLSKDGPYDTEKTYPDLHG